MRSDIKQVKVGYYHVVRETRGFRVVHTWTGVAIGTWATAPEAIRAARRAGEESYLLRTFGKDDALKIIRARNGYLSES